MERVHPPIKKKIVLQGLVDSSRTCEIPRLPLPGEQEGIFPRQASLSLFSLSTSGGGASKNRHSLNEQAMFPSITVLKLSNKPNMDGICPMNWGRVWGSESPSPLPNVTQPVGGGVGSPFHALPISCPTSLISAFGPHITAKDPAWSEEEVMPPTGWQEMPEVLKKCHLEKDVMIHRHSFFHCCFRRSPFILNGKPTKTGSLRMKDAIER